MAAKFTEQLVVMLAPSIDDRIRNLALRHRVSVGKAARVVIRYGLERAETMQTENFLQAHLLDEISAARLHADCCGSHHRADG